MEKPGHLDASCVFVTACSVPGTGAGRAFYKAPTGAICSQKFAAGPDGSVKHGPIETLGQQPPIPITGAPASCVSSDGVFYCFAPDAKGGIVYLHGKDGAWAWSTIPAPQDSITGRIAASAFEHSHVDVFTSTNEGIVRTRVSQEGHSHSPDATQWDYVPVDQFCGTSSVMCVSPQPGVLELLAWSDAGTLVRSTLHSGNWSPAHEILAPPSSSALQGLSSCCLVSPGVLMVVCPTSASKGSLASYYIQLEHPKAENGSPLHHVEKATRALAAMPNPAEAAHVSAVAKSVHVREASYDRWTVLNCENADFASNVCAVGLPSQNVHGLVPSSFCIVNAAVDFEEGSNLCKEFLQISPFIAGAPNSHCNLLRGTKSLKALSIPGEAHARALSFAGTHPQTPSGRVAIMHVTEESKKSAAAHANHVAALKASSAASLPVETFGWDTVYGIRFSKLNPEFKKNVANTAELHAFSQKDDDYDVSINGTFGAWELSSGTGTNLYIRINVLSGTAKVMAKSFDLAGAKFDALVELQYLDGLTTATPAVPVKNLQCKPAISVVQTSFISSASTMTAVQTSVISSLFDSYLQSNFTKLRHVFVQVSMTAATDYDWLKPVWLNYTIASDNATPPNNVLCVLQLCGDAKTAKDRAQYLSSQASAGVAVQGYDGGWALSRDLFMQKKVLPSLTTQFPGGNFQWSNSQKFLVNTSQFGLPKVSNAGTNYYPKVDAEKMTVKLEDRRIKVSANWHVDVSPGVQAVGVMNRFFKLEQRVGEKESTWALTDDGTGNSESHMEVADWVKVTELVIKLVASVAAAALDSLIKATDLWKEVLRVILEELVLTLLTKIAEIIEAQGEKAIEDIVLSDPFLSSGFGIAEWKGVQQPFIPKIALLENCFLLGGSFEK